MIKKGIIRKNRRYFRLYDDKILYYNVKYFNIYINLINSNRNILIQIINKI
jgi:hypothetical protein